MTNPGHTQKHYRVCAPQKEPTATEKKGEKDTKSHGSVAARALSVLLPYGPVGVKRASSLPITACGTPFNFFSLIFVGLAECRQAMQSASYRASAAVVHRGGVWREKAWKREQEEIKTNSEILKKAHHHFRLHASHVKIVSIFT